MSPSFRKSESVCWSACARTALINPPSGMSPAGCLVMSRFYLVVLIALLLPAPGLAQEARLIVTVSDYHGTPIPDAEVRVWDSRKQTMVVMGSTDNDGLVVLEVKPFEHYEVQATREGF